jgi:hypothetical protein
VNHKNNPENKVTFLHFSFLNSLNDKCIFKHIGPKLESQMKPSGENVLRQFSIIAKLSTSHARAEA